MRMFASISPSNGGQTEHRSTNTQRHPSVSRSPISSCFNRNDTAVDPLHQGQRGSQTLISNGPPQSRGPAALCADFQSSAPRARALRLDSNGETSDNIQCYARLELSASVDCCVCDCTFFSCSFLCLPSCSVLTPLCARKQSYEESIEASKADRAAAAAGAEPNSKKKKK